MKSELKTKKCKICKTSFPVYSSLKIVCSPKCAIANLNQKTKKDNKKDLREYNQANKSKSDYSKEAQIPVNKCVRLRDYDKPCISCDKPASNEPNQWDAGHYRSRGSAPHLRFNLKNIHKQCKRCNRELSGNIVEFRKRLIVRIGLEEVEKIENDQTIRRFEKDYLQRIKQIFNKKARLLDKRRG